MIKTVTIELLFSASIVCILAAEPLSAESWQRAPAPTPDVVKSATFGPKPSTTEIELVSLMFSPGKPGHLRSFLLSMDSTTHGRFQVSRDPKREYLYLPGANGEAGTYRFGWAQEFRIESAGNAYFSEDYLYVFFENGKPTYFSRTTTSDCHNMPWFVLRASKIDFRDTCGSAIGEVLGEHCMVPMGSGDSTSAACAQIGDAVEMSSDFVIPSTPVMEFGLVRKHPWHTAAAFRIVQGMTESQAMKAARAAGAEAEKGKGSRWGSDVLKINNTFFLLRGGRIYARKWEQTELPQK